MSGSTRSGLGLTVPNLERRSAGMQFHKYHALGNDYLVLDPKDCPTLYSPLEIEKICHRHFGLGSDGILFGPLPTDEADFGLQIWNPDGSEAEKSGNGLRIFCRYLLDQGRVGTEPFTIMTLGGKVTCQIHDGGAAIEVEMGTVSFHSDDIPVLGGSREVLNESVEIDGETYHYYAATIGNPHVVLPMDTDGQSDRRAGLQDRTGAREHDRPLSQPHQRAAAADCRPQHHPHRNLGTRAPPPRWRARWAAATNAFW